MGVEKSKKKKEDVGKVGNGRNMAPSVGKDENQEAGMAPRISTDPHSSSAKRLLIKLMNTFIVKHAFIKHSFIPSNYKTQQA